MRRDIVVIGGSAGSIEALQALVGSLPLLPEVSVLLVVHIPAAAPSALPQILARAGAWPAVHAVDGSPLLRGTIVVAPPDRHLVVQGGRVRLTRGLRESPHRPSIDVLFRSAARWGGPRVIGVVLSGLLDDGTAGMRAVRAHGGLALVQSPDDALYAAMPSSVIDHVGVDAAAPAAGLAQALVERLTEDLGAAVAPSPDLSGRALHDLVVAARGAGARDRSCAADEVRWQPRGAIPDGSVEQAMWTGYRALVESASLARRLATWSRQRGRSELVRRYEAREDVALTRARVIREALGATDDAESPARPWMDGYDEV